MKRRQWIAAAIAVGSPLLMPGAFAQDGFPSRPLSLVVPFAPGGPTDLMARTIANAIRPVLGQPMLVDNRPGAGGNIGAEHVARSTADGHTLLFGTSGPLAINSYLYGRLNYDPISSFAPVLQVGHLPNVLVVHPSVPANDVRSLVAHAKAHPGTLSFASSGNGASSHLAGVMFNMRTGTDLQHVPYRGTGPALNDLLGGQVQMAFTDVLTALPHIQSGRLRALGVTTAKRSAALPELPTIQEQGVADYDVSVFFGIVVPSGTPQAVVSRLNAALVQVLNQPEVRKTLSSQGLESPPATTPAQLAVYMRREQARWADVVKASGARVD